MRSEQEIRFLIAALEDLVRSDCDRARHAATPSEWMSQHVDYLANCSKLALLEWTLGAEYESQRIWDRIPCPEFGERRPCQSQQAYTPARRVA